MQGVPDGTYDAVVVDAEHVADGDVRIELTITLGPHVGEMVALRKNRHVDDRGGPLDTSDPYALLGVAGTLRVRDGVPSFRPETP